MYLSECFGHGYPSSIEATNPSVGSRVLHVRNMVCNLSKGSHSTASNYRMSVNLAQEDLKEEDTVHQMMEDMDLGNQDSHPTNIGQDEAINKHVFH
jgi:hypothetical protein